jgi:hypothetical protein
VTPSGTSFSDLQAVVQAWQPMQRCWSMTFAHVTDVTDVTAAAGGRGGVLARSGIWMASPTRYPL